MLFGRRLLMAALLALGPLCQAEGLAWADEYDRQLGMIAQDLAGAAGKNGIKTIAVLDFTNLQGDVTELGRFIAEELASRLVMPNEAFRVIDRANIRNLLDEHKLSMSGLVNPDNAKQLGKIAGVDGLVLGTITPLSDDIKLSVKLLSVETAMVVGVARGDLARTKAIEELLLRDIAPGPGATSGGRGQAVAGGPSQSRNSSREFSNDKIHLVLKSMTRVDNERAAAVFRVQNLTEESVPLSLLKADAIDDRGGSWRCDDVTGINKPGYMGKATLPPGSENTFRLLFQASGKVDAKTLDIVLEFEAPGESRMSTFTVSMRDVPLGN